MSKITAHVRATAKIPPPSPSSPAKATGMPSAQAPPDPSGPVYKPTMYQVPFTFAPTNVISNSTPPPQESTADLLNSGLITSGSGNANGTTSGSSGSASGSAKKSGSSRVSAVTGVLGLS